MGISDALGTGLSGLTANQTMLNIVGNNIANANTVGYKTQSVNFETQLAQTFSYGTAPLDTNGGTNPMQIGNGTATGATTRNFNDGSQQITGVDTQMAIQGDGFFVVQGAQQLFTRAGNFQLNNQHQLVDGNGNMVQGYGIDSGYNIIPGALTNVTIPVGSLTLAKGTSNVTMEGNLNAGGTVATTATASTLDQSFYLAGASAVDPVNPPTTTTLLTSLANATNTPYFQNGDVITVQGEKGTRSVGTQTLTVTGTTTLGDLESFMTGVLGINTTTGANGTASAAGITNTTTGNAVALNITGNIGTANDLTLSASSLSIQRGTTTVAPFTFTKSATANGESVYTSFNTYDSLGNAVSVGVTATMVSSTATGTTWQYFAESPNTTTTGAATNTAVGTGLLSFNTAGQLGSTTTPTITIDRSGTGAVPNLTFNVNFGNMTALSSGTSQMASATQDGYAQGTLQTFSVGTDGIIAGSFSNGLTRNLGQIALATFRNDDGLVDVGSNNFVAGTNSGTPIISAPGQFSAGTVVGGSLEQSNVDLSAEFVKMIAASTGFSAASRIITTSNQMLQELMAAGR